MTEILQTIGSALEGGGFVMPPLFVLALSTAWGLGVRALILQKGNARDPHRDLHRALSGGFVGRPNALTDVAVCRICQVVQGHTNFALRRHKALAVVSELHETGREGKGFIKTLVSVAPLLGLLGTVAGMIETFQSLGDMALFAQSGGVAGGISQALLTTQVGLAVAIPGLVLGRLLERRELLLHDYLERLVDAASALEVWP